MYRQNFSRTITVVGRFSCTYTKLLGCPTGSSGIHNMCPLVALLVQVKAGYHKFKRLAASVAHCFRTPKSICSSEKHKTNDSTTGSSRLDVSIGCPTCSSQRWNKFDIQDTTPAVTIIQLKATWRSHDYIRQEPTNRGNHNHILLVSTQRHPTAASK